MSEMDFEGQRDGEEVELIFRPHILTASGGIIWLIICAGIGVAPLFIWPDQSILFWVFCIAVLIGLIICIRKYMMWYFSFYVVTDERIRQNIQHGLFRRTVVDLELDKIQSISYNIPGLFGGIFSYGTILIQSPVGDMELHKISHPAKIYEQIQEVIGRNKRDA